MTMDLLGLIMLLLGWGAFGAPSVGDDAISVPSHETGSVEAMHDGTPPPPR
jgi:hypothetical protein